MSLGHGTDKDSNALLGTNRLKVVSGPHNGGLETESHLAAVGRQVVGDGVLDHLQQLLLRVGGADGQTVEQLDHQTRKTLEGSGNANGGVDFDQNTLSSVDKDLQAASLVDGRVEKGKKALGEEKRRLVSSNVYT